MPDRYYNHSLNDQSPPSLTKQDIENYCTFWEQYVLDHSESQMKDDPSVYDGYGGLLYYYLENLHRFGEQKYLSRCLQLAKHLESQLPSPPYFSKHNISFVTGHMGVHSLCAVTYFFHEMMEQFEHSISEMKKLLSLVQDPCYDELLYGRSGTLFALFFVNKMVNKEIFSLTQCIQPIIQSILSNGIQTSQLFHQQLQQFHHSSPPLLWQWRDKLYLGAAHGVAGISYILLHYGRELLSNNDLQLLEQTLDWIIANARYQNTDNFYSSINLNHANKSEETDQLVQWCHGSPGFIPLLTLFSKTKTILYSCGDDIWKRGVLKKGVGICHGLSGNLLSLWKIYNTNPTDSHLKNRVLHFAKLIVEETEYLIDVPDVPTSLMNGVLGALFVMKQVYYSNLLQEDNFDCKIPCFDM